MRWFAVFVAAWLAVGTAAAAPPKIVDLGWGFTSVYALVGDDAVVIVDTQNRKKHKKILRHMRKAGIDRTLVKLILLTHGHADHAGSAKALGYHLQVPIMVGLGDEGMLAKGTMDIHPTGGRGRMVKAFVKKKFPPFETDIVLRGQTSLAQWGVGGQVIPVGGHTPGSLVIDLGNDVLVGDLVRSEIFRRHRATLHFFHDDLATAHRALRHVTAGAQTVWPTHGGPISKERVIRWLDRYERHQRR